MPEKMHSAVTRLPGTDGGAKMGKSLGNAIHLSDDEATVNKSNGMFTDPNRLTGREPGNVEAIPSSLTTTRSTRIKPVSRN
jgi:tryptophanyl-tRNA synthetase